MGNIQTVGPNEALIVSGGCCRPSRKQIIVGGWCWNTWMLTNIQRLSLQLMTVSPRCEQVLSETGVPVTVTGVVHCKIMSAAEFLPLAAEQFLGKSTEHIKSVVLQTVEGHMRAVIGSQPIEDICRKRQQLASMIREATTKDLSRMGIDVMSLTIKDVRDDVEYLSSLGKKSIADVKREAGLKADKASREASQDEAQRAKERRELQLESESKLATLHHDMEHTRAARNEQVGQRRAEAAKAYDLQLACLQKAIRSVEMEVKSMEFDGLIEVHKKENERRRMELEIDVQLPAEAERHELEQQTLALRRRLECERNSERYRIEQLGEASAEAARLEGEAEAEGMLKVARARQGAGPAATLYEVLRVLPEVAAEVCSPLSKFDDIVLLSEGSGQVGTPSEPRSPPGALSMASNAAKLASALPLALKSVGGQEKQGAGLINSLLRMQRLGS